MNEYQIERIREYGNLTLNSSFKELTTIRIGGQALGLFHPNSILSLQAMIRFCKKEGLNYYVLGNGSNILATDDPYPGIIIKLSREFNEVYAINDIAFEVHAGASLIVLSHKARKLGLSGLEWASGIPASIGGATYMNAGAYKSCMADIITEVCVLKEDQVEWMPVEACNFSYRHSIFREHPDWIIIAIRIKLEKGTAQEIEELMSQRQQRRLASQPLQSPSFGSTFRNPGQHLAWQLIDQCQYRGYQIGGAQVSEKHTNFLINANQASFEDMYRLITAIQEKVKEVFQVELLLEVEILNGPDKSRSDEQSTEINSR